MAVTSTGAAEATYAKHRVATALIPFLVRHRGLALLLMVYLFTVVALPTMTPVAISDDWVYARSVEVLLTERRLQILEVSAASAVPQIVWGAPFAAVLDDLHGALRIATVVFMAATSVTFYALARLLEVGRARSLLGVAIYLFNPLGFVLGYTFMTDPYFVGLVVVSTYFYARSTVEERSRYVLIGSCFAALASLQRQLGFLLPAGAIAYWLWDRSVRLDRSTVVRLLNLGLPLVVAVLFAAITEASSERPYTRLFLDSILAADGSDWATVLGRIAFLEIMYIGLLVLPLGAVAVASVPRMASRMTGRGWTAFGLFAIALITGLVNFAGRTMPYVGQFVNVAGLGPGDVLGERPAVLQGRAAVLLTVVCAVAGLAILLALCSLRPSRSQRPGLAVVGAIGGLQALGVALPSFYFLHAGGSLDRYLLPMVPFAVLFALVAIPDLEVRSVAAWVAVAVMAAFSVLGTRDFLTFQAAVWQMAREANEAGISNTQLDAGAAWTGQHLWGYSYANDIEVRTPNGPWWTSLYGPATDSTYVVSTVPISGYEVVNEVHYSSWMVRAPTPLYLSRRDQ